MKQTFCSLLPALLMLAASAQEKTASKDAWREQGNRALAILERAEWKNLFNGKDLAGWHGDTAGYVARDGLLICQKGAKDLRTDQVYRDFAVTFEFKLEESGNNGIGIRVPEGGHPSRDGMEIQILDHDGSRYSHSAEVEGKKRTISWLKPWQYHGSIYGIYPARTGYLKPAGQWNTETIVAIEDHIMVILNGAVIVDAFLEDLTPPEPGHHGYKNREGQIVLAGHSDHVEFRNLKVADYRPSPPRPSVAAANTAPAGFSALFNGKDLTNWRGLAHGNANERRALAGESLEKAQAAADENMRQHWTVIDGVLAYDGKGQSLCSDQKYGDFELYVDWKVLPGGDSGVYLRGTPQVGIWDPWKPQSKKDQPAPATPQEWVESYRNGQNLGSGSLWNNRRHRNHALTLADRPAGEWNTFLIRMVGDKVTVWLNDKLVTDRVRLENYWDKEGREPLARADQIELQQHGSELYFRNLYLRELPY